jgi:hypothetical protein
MPNTRPLARRYRIVFRGESAVLARAFPDLTPEFVGGDTTLVGTIVDQAQLLGMLERADSLGFELVSLNPIKPETEGPS